MLLLANGRVIDPATNTDDMLDILIDGDKIASIGAAPEGYAGAVLDASGLIVAPGLVDTHVHFRDPGDIRKEDLRSGAHAAAKGGFTTVICMANTSPVIDNAAVMEDISYRARLERIRVRQACAVTLGQRGTRLVNMEALAAAGAACFSDDGQPLRDSAIVAMALRKAAALGVPVCMHEEDPALIDGQGVNAGIVSELINLPGAPAVAEDVLVARDCMLALESGAKVVIQHISTARSVAMVRFARSMGAKVEAEATPHHFSLTEEDVLDYGTLAKMNPPLRTEDDRIALIEGLRDGTVRFIATDHAPHTQEEKTRPFPSAPSGIIGLETALSLGIMKLVEPGHIGLMGLLSKMTCNPAAFYGLNAGCLRVGAPADLVLFDPARKWIARNFASKSRNTPFMGRKMTGRVLYTICRGEIVYSLNPQAGGESAAIHRGRDAGE